MTTAAAANRLAKRASSCARDGPGRSGTAIPGCTRTRSRRVEGEPAPGDVVSLTDHDGRFIGKGFYNARSQIPVRLCTRADEAVDAAFLRRRIERARAARARLGLPSADTNAYRLVNSEGDDLPGLVVDIYADAAVVQITTLAMSMRRAEIYDALEAELGVKTIFELAPASYAELEGYAAGSRVARGASRATRAGASKTASRWRSSRSPGRRPACSSTSARRAPRVAALARGARVLDVYAYAGGFGAGRGARGRHGRHRRRQLGARGRPHHRPRRGQRRRRSTRSKPTRSATSRRRRRAPSIWSVIDPPKFARARKDLEAARKGYERLNALALQAVAPGGDPGDLLVLAERRRRDVRAHRRRRRQAGRPRGARLRAPRPRRRPPAAARRSPRASTSRSCSATSPEPARRSVLRPAATPHGARHPCAAACVDRRPGISHRRRPGVHPAARRIAWRCRLAALRDAERMDDAARDTAQLVARGSARDPAGAWPLPARSERRRPASSQ